MIFGVGACIVGIFGVIAMAWKRSIIGIDAEEETPPNPAMLYWMNVSPVACDGHL